MDDQQQVLNEEGRALWNQKAAFWDELHGDEGNVFHRKLVAPAVERLLAIQPGEHVLDIACGSGVVARRLAALGARVKAVDFSAALIERARARGGDIAYAVADATDEDALVSYGEGQFDAIVSTMALMDIPVIVPLYRAVRRLLVPNGRLVVVTSHPAFHSNNPVFAAELEDKDGQTYTHYLLKIAAYLDVPPGKQMGAPNEPNPHYYYHRPLHQLLGEAFAAGLVLDALEEPSISSADAESAAPLSWRKYWQFPPVMAVRLRRAGE